MWNKSTVRYRRGAVDSRTVRYPGTVGYRHGAVRHPRPIRHRCCIYPSIEKSLHQIRIVCYFLRPFGCCRFIHDRSVLVIDSSKVFLLGTFDITPCDSWHDLSDDQYSTCVVVFLVCVVTHGRQHDEFKFIKISFEILIHWIVGQE